MKQITTINMPAARMQIEIRSLKQAAEAGFVGSLHIPHNIWTECNHYDIVTA